MATPPTDTRPTNLIISARSATRDVWLSPDFDLALSDRIARGQVDGLGFVPRLVKDYYGKRLGDLLHTGGLGIMVASRSLVSALTELEATGFRTYRLEIEHPLIEPGDYVGLAVTGSRGVDDLYQYHPLGPGGVVGIRRELLEELERRGVDAFEVEEDDGADLRERLAATVITISASSDERDVWLLQDELPVDDPVLLDKVALGQIDNLRFGPHRVGAGSGERLADLLYTGLPIKVASRRLVDALTELGAGGFTSFTLEIEHPLIGPADYVGLAVTGRRGVDDLFQVDPEWASEEVGIRLEVLEVLLARSIDAFRVDYEI